MEKILVLDFGGQYNQLIARRVRDHPLFHGVPEESAYWMSHTDYISALPQ